MRGSRASREETVEKRTSASLVGRIAAAKKLGPALGARCTVVACADTKERAQRRIRGVLGFARKNGAEHLDGVCAIAIKAGAPPLRFVRIYLRAQVAGRIALAKKSLR